MVKRDIIRQTDERSLSMVTDWNSLPAFYETINAGSFRAAATLLNIDATTVGRRVQHLQDVLGVPLVVRLSNGVKATPAGQRVYDKISEIYRLAKELHVEASYDSGFSGVVRLAVTDGVGAYFLPEIIPIFRDRYPDICIEVMCANHVPDLIGMKADIAISYQRPVSSDLSIVGEGQVTFRPFASQSYVKKHGVPKTIKEFQHHYVIYSTNFPRAGEFPAWDRAVSLARKVVARTDSSLSLGYMTKFGSGIGLHPDKVLLREPDFVFIEVDGLSYTIKQYMYCRRDMKDVPRIRAVIDFIKQIFFSRKK